MQPNPEPDIQTCTLTSIDPLTVTLKYEQRPGLPVRGPRTVVLAAALDHYTPAVGDLVSVLADADPPVILGKIHIPAPTIEADGAVTEHDA